MTKNNTSKTKMAMIALKRFMWVPLKAFNKIKNADIEIKSKKLFHVFSVLNFFRLILP